LSFIYFFILPNHNFLVIPQKVGLKLNVDVLLKITMKRIFNRKWTKQREKERGSLVVFSLFYQKD